MSGYDCEEFTRVGISVETRNAHFRYDPMLDAWRPVTQLAFDLALTRGMQSCLGMGFNPRDERETERPTMRMSTMDQDFDRTLEALKTVAPGTMHVYQGPWHEYDLHAVLAKAVEEKFGVTEEMERAWRNACAEPLTFHGVPVVFDKAFPTPEENPVEDRYTITDAGRGMTRITGKDAPEHSASDIKALAKATATPQLPAHLQAQAIRRQRGQELTQRLLASIEVLLDRGGDLPADITQTASELTTLLGSTELGYHRVLAPQALEVVNDPVLHAQATAQAMRKENALAAIPDTDPMKYDPEAVAAYAERAQGQMDAIEAAYQDGFAMGQRDMVEQLEKLGTVALLKAKLRMLLGRPANIVEDSADLTEEPAAEDRGKAETLHQELADREDLTFRGIHLEDVRTTLLPTDPLAKDPQP